MRALFILILLVFFFCPFSAGTGNAAVEWSLGPAVRIGTSPKDMAVSANGNRFYVLTEKGDILIYQSDGHLEDTIHVGDRVDFLEAGPNENLLLVGSRKDKTLQTLSLESIRDIDISQAPVLGPADAPVVIAVFMDYQCPYCARLEPLLDQVLEKNPKNVKIAFKNFPLKMHKAALSAAEASLVADKEGKFLAFRSLMFDDYQNLNEEKILDIAADLGLDKNEFKAKMNSPAVVLQIQRDIKDGKQAGVSGIPTVFINGRKLKNRSLEEFQKMIDQEMMKHGGS